jgi:Mg2+ and Co2+ transporter CorA
MTPTPDAQGSVAAMLDADADAVQEDVARLSRRIETLESEIVEARSRREEQARRMVEMRTAANILREVGLRSSIVKGVLFVEVDYQPKRPEGAAR